MLSGTSRTAACSLRVNSTLSGARRLSTRPILLGRRSSPLFAVAPTSARSFSWSPWGSKPAPTASAVVPPEVAFVSESVPLAAPPASTETISSVDASSSAFSDTLNSASSALSETASSLPELTSSTLPVALQAGDMAAAGLTGLSPAGLVCSLLETVHLSTGLAWAPTIALTTIGLRVLLLWPQIRSSRAAARLQPHQARLEAISSESMAATRAGDMARAQQLALERSRINEKAGVKTSDMLLGPFTMLPVQLGLFFGVKRMCDLPLPQLVADGMAWIPSLAGADPTWILPIVNTVVIQGTLWFSLKDASTEKAAHTMNAIRVLSLTGLPFMIGLSSALNLVILTQSVFGMVQAGLLRQAFVRRALGMPPISHDFKRPTMKDSLSLLKTFLDDAQRQAEAAARDPRKRR